MVDLNRDLLVNRYGKDKLSDLTFIDLTDFEIIAIDSNTFKGLVKLKTLRLDDNELEELDERTFENLSNLNELWLNDNNLEKIDFYILEGLTNLAELWLDENRIREIVVGSFHCLSNLSFLDLSKNKLKRVESNTFKGLKNLKKLFLNNNQIEAIELESFETLSNLIELHLDNNKLKVIYRRCFEPLKSIESIVLFENAGLTAVSLYPHANLGNYGAISDFDEFLLQFPVSENQREQKAAKEKESTIERKKKEKQAADGQKAIVIDEAMNRIEERNNNANLRQSIEQDQYSDNLFNYRYKVLRKIGRGSFGSVYLVEDTNIDRMPVKQKAMKIMDELDSVTENELDLFLDIIHENIVRYFDHFHLRIQDENKTFLITEYCKNGDLKYKINETRRLDKNFSDTQILEWISQATNALNYLHSKKPYPIIHRDIKPANMLLNGRNEIKLTDLGISKLMENTHASTYAGSKQYMSPEVFRAQIMRINYYPNTDIWSLGCVLFELIFLTIAFPKGQYGEPSIPSNIYDSGIFRRILPKMLEKNIPDRISSRHLLPELENLSNENNNIIYFSTSKTL